jgi:hypothetical protein
LMKHFSTFIISIKGQPGAHSTRLYKVQELWVLCTQSFPAFLQEDVFRT